MFLTSNVAAPCTGSHAIVLPEPIGVFTRPDAILSSPRPDCFWTRYHWQTGTPRDFLSQVFVPFAPPGRLIFLL